LRIRRLADPQKSKDAWARYSKLNRRILNTKSRDHYAANIDAKRERARRDHANNREVNNARSRRYYQENKQKVLVQKTNWLAKHPGYAASVVRNRRALKKGNGGTHTVAEVIAILKKQNYRCVYCNISIRHKRHMDHIKPLSRGGSNNAKNLQGLCPSCNSSKNDKTHAEYVKFLKLRNAA
jgi:5-methylcytosine-specific restriction endonuclease McrA